MSLTPSLAEIVNLERTMPRETHLRRRIVRDRFAIGLDRYEQLLTRALDDPVASAVAPTLTARLRTKRDRRRELRHAESDRRSTPPAVSPSQQSLGLYERRGEERKAMGMAIADDAELPEWKDRADSAIRVLAERGGPFTAENVRAMAGDPSHYNAMGPRMLAASKAGLIRKVGMRKSERPTLHAHPIAVWVGAQWTGVTFVAEGESA